MEGIHTAIISTIARVIHEGTTQMYRTDFRNFSCMHGCTLALIRTENMKIHDFFFENLVNLVGGTKIQYTKHPEFDFWHNYDSIGLRILEV